MNTDDYLQGMRDCKEGREHKPGMSQDYDEGYSAEYEREEVLTIISDWRMLCQ